MSGYDDNIRALLQRVDEESPAPSELNREIVEPVTLHSERRRSWAPMVAAAAVVVIVGTFLLFGGGQGESVKVSDDSTEESADVTATGTIDFGLPAVFDRPRTEADVLPERIAASFDEHTPVGRDGTLEFDLERSRLGLESKGITVWIVPAVDDRAVCVMHEKPTGEPASRTCRVFTSKNVFGALTASSADSARTVIAGAVNSDEIVDVVDAEFRDGVFLSVGPGVPSTSPVDLAEPTFVFSDGTTGTASEAREAFFEVCGELWSLFFSGDQLIESRDLERLQPLAALTRTPAVRRTVDALAGVAAASAEPVPVASPRWSEAWPEGIAICAQPGMFGYGWSVVGGELGTEPGVDLDLIPNGGQIQLIELGRLSEQGGLAGSLATARRSADCLLVDLAPDFLGRPENTEVELGCGIGIYETTVATRFGDERVTGALLPDDASYVLIRFDMSGHAVMRPVDGVVLFTASADMQPVTFDVYRADGQQLTMN